MDDSSPSRGWAPHWSTLPTPFCPSAKDASHGVSQASTCGNSKPVNEGRVAGSPRTARWRPTSGARRRSCAARSGFSGARVSRTPFAPGNGSLRLPPEQGAAHSSRSPRSPQARCRAPSRKRGPRVSRSFPAGWIAEQQRGRCGTISGQGWRSEL